MTKVILAYVPVLHEGYRRFFEKYKDADLYILGPEIIAEFSQLGKEIRQLDPEIIKKSLQSWEIFESITVANKKEIREIEGGAEKIIMPDEEIMHEFAEKYFSGKETVFDAVFLRWDKHSTTKEKEVNFDRKISAEEFDKEMILAADKEAKKSSDWWRRIGSVIVKDGKSIVFAHNKHVPSEHMPYVNGDPRSNFHKGDHLELSTAIHSEAAAIAEAARLGVSLEGASIYVTTFPCPPCAKLIAYSGIKKIYYTIGYGILDGESILKDKGVEIIFVDVDIPQKKGLGDIEYKK
jgi:dCMP deaminase